MRKFKSFIATSLTLITALSCCLGVADVPSGNKTATVANAKTKVKTQTINLEKGDTYKVKIKKNSKIKLSKKKILKVSKKGVIKALKVGKCKITVKKGKKTWKYNVVVKKKNDKKIIPTPAPTMVPTVAPTAAPGGYEILSGFIVDGFEKVNDSFWYVYLVDDPNIEGSSMPNDPAVKYVRISVGEKSLKGICVGYEVSILKYYPSQSKIEGDKCIYDGINNIRLDKKEVNAPTEKPIHCSMRKCDINLLQEEITTETKYLTFERNFTDRELTFFVSVDGVLFEKKYRPEKPGFQEFNFYIDFSLFKPGSEIVVGIEPYSDIIETEKSITYYSTGFYKETFLLDGKPKITEESKLWVYLNQQDVLLPKDTQTISGRVKCNDSMDTIVEVKVNNTVIAEKELKAGEARFSFPVDFSECKAGDKVYITYSRAGGDLEIYETDENFVHHMVWPVILEYELKE